MTGRAHRVATGLLRFTAIIVLLAQGNEFLAQDRIMAITVDDLPCTNCHDTENARVVMNGILYALRMHHGKATGFVNEGKLHRDGALDQERTGLLRTWLLAGHELGNHTWSHIAVNTATLDEYKEDVLKGERICRPLMEEFGKQLTYFRHTQLRTGPTIAFRDSLNAFLDAHRYITAPVTMDNDEYIFAYCYDHARQLGDSAGMRIVAYEYLQYMNDVVRHYERLSRDFLGYDMRHILLLHANRLNADHLDALLQQLKQRGYTFVTLKEALADSAYQRPVGFTPRGLSWLNRWQIAEGLEPTEQPPVKDRIRERMAHCRSLQKAYPGQAFRGDTTDLSLIKARIRHFSTMYLARDFSALAACYTTDGRIMPGASGIIEGRDAIREQWTLPEDEVVLEHVITPLEIVVQDGVAYDHGYYEGRSRITGRDPVRWSGKYLIIWKKVDGEWLIHRDIWNRL